MSRANSFPAGPHGALAAEPSMENRPASAIVTPTHKSQPNDPTTVPAMENSQQAPNNNNNNSWVNDSAASNNNETSNERQDGESFLPSSAPPPKGEVKGKKHATRPRNQSIATAAIEQTMKNVQYKQAKDEHMDKVTAVAGEYRELVDTETTTKGMFSSEINEIRKFLVSPSLQQYFLQTKLPAVVAVPGLPSSRQPIHPHAAPPRGKVNYSTLFQEQKEMEEKLNASHITYCQKVARLEDERQNLSRGWSLLLMDHNTGNGVLQTVQETTSGVMDEEGEDEDDVQGYTVQEITSSFTAPDRGNAATGETRTPDIPIMPPIGASPYRSGTPISARSALANRPASANKNRPSSANRPVSARSVGFNLHGQPAAPETAEVSDVRKEVLPTVFGDAIVSARANATTASTPAPAPTASAARPTTPTIESYARPLSSHDMGPASNGAGVAPPLGIADPSTPASNQGEVGERREPPGPKTTVLLGSGSISSDMGTSGSNPSTGSGSSRMETSVLTSAPPLTNQPLTSLTPRLDADAAAIVRRCCGDLNVDANRYLDILGKNLFVTRSDMAEISLDEFLLMEFPLKLAKVIRKAFATGTAPPPMSAPLRPMV